MLADALRLHRRVCLLRASGQDQAATELARAELSEKLGALRTQGDQPELAASLAAQEARVTEAWILAEMIAPLLASRLNSSQFTPVAPSGQTLETHRHGAVRPVRSPAAPVLSVADFIEGMLEQERTAATSA